MWSVQWSTTSYIITDLDECATNQHNCSDRMHCNNTMGSYECTCKEGYNFSMGNEEKCQGNKKCVHARPLKG